MSYKQLPLNGIASRIEGDGISSNPRICSSSYSNGLYYVELNKGYQFSSSPIVLVTVDTTSMGDVWTGIISVHHVTGSSFQVSIQDCAGGNHPLPFSLPALNQQQAKSKSHFIDCNEMMEAAWVTRRPFHSLNPFFA